MRNVERFFIGIAWLMGFTMIAIAVAHVAFLITDLRPDGGRDNGWIPIIGDVPIPWMVFGWEVPTAALILGGLIYQRPMPRFGSTATIVGVTSFGMHFFYFVPIPILAVLVTVGILIRSGRLVELRSRPRQAGEP